MIAASEPRQRPADARLLVVSASGEVRERTRASWHALLRSGDVVVANDAATMPASLPGVHELTGRAIELRLAARRSLARDDLAFDAIVFGEGDHRTRTEDRPLPPPLEAGEVLILGEGRLRARIEARLDHPRLVRISFAAAPDAFWSALARHGRPVQYAHVPSPLALWDVWTVVAGPPVAFEPPSAGFVLDWTALRQLRDAGATFATLTHAAGLSSTGDPALDARLPFDEAYRIPRSTEHAIARARASGGRVVAIGTTVVRALAHAQGRSGRVVGGEGLADQRIGASTSLGVVDVILSGTHEPGTSHRELLRAFAEDEVLARVDRALEERGFRTHEFGDSVWVERSTARQARGLERAVQGSARLTPRRA